MMGCPAQARLGAGSPLLPSSAAQTRLLQSPLLGRSLGASRAWPRLAGPSTTPVCSAAVQIREILPAASNNGVKVSHKEMSAPAAGYLANNSTSYKEEHKIRAYEVGPDQKTSIVTIANLLQASKDPLLTDLQQSWHPCCISALVAGTSALFAITSQHAIARNHLRLAPYI